MRWEGGEEGSDVEDRRGLGPAHIGGGLSVVGVVIALIGYFVFHIDPRAILAAEQGAGPVAQQQGVSGAPKDTQGRFANVVFTSVNKTWAAQFQQRGATWENPTLVLYDQATTTGCGFGQAAMGPFYCPRDRKVYLDLNFFQELSDRFGARGDFARAYVIAHEVGHHVQKLTGVSDRAENLQRQAMAYGDKAGANKVSVGVELQADCYAGVWAHAYQGTGRLEAGDIDSALSAATAVGDDTLQKASRGEVVPESFTHGSAAQRTAAFRRGYDSGDMGACSSLTQGRGAAAAPEDDGDE